MSPLEVQVYARLGVGEQVGVPNLQEEARRFRRNSEDGLPIFRHSGVYLIYEEGFT